jgi:hypothetical protein
MLLKSVKVLEDGTIHGHRLPVALGIIFYLVPLQARRLTATEDGESGERSVLFRAALLLASLLV